MTNNDVQKHLEYRETPEFLFALYEFAAPRRKKRSKDFTRSNSSGEAVFTKTWRWGWRRGSEVRRAFP